MSTQAVQAIKKYKGRAKVIVFAGVAKPNPKLGQSLGPLGLNMMMFCKEFNERTKLYHNDLPLRVIIKAYTDRSFTFVVKPPPTSWYLKRIAMTGAGRKDVEDGNPFEIGVKHLYYVAMVKKQLDPDFKYISLFSICKMIIAQADAMGFVVVRETELTDPIITRKIV